MENSVILAAPAKLNLGLEILGQGGGFHQLETLFQTLELADTVHVTRRDDGQRELYLTGGGPAGAENLAWRAAAAWRDLVGDHASFAIHIEKRIPAGGGLGGGSSDAAAVLRACQRLGRPLPAPQLAELALELGSDVPFFLLGGSAHAVGRGEQLSALDDLPQPWPGDLHLLLPPWGCATPAVFKALTNAERGPRPARGADAAAAAWRVAAPGVLDNRLAAGALRVEPRQAQLHAWLAASGRPWAMSGSGSTCYCFGDPGPAPADCRIVTTAFRPRARLDAVHG
jgi:4-diphosphocytidyl-2-C-methyl-D-erythritol kinase